MGKFPPAYTDSEEDFSSMESVKKKKKFSLFRYRSGTFRKKKYQAKSEPDSESDCLSRSRSSSRSSIKVASNSTRKLVGILKHTERESSEDDEDYMAQSILFRSQNRCLVGQVPRPPGTKPGRGGGVAILVRKNVSNLPSQQSSISSIKRKKPMKRLSRKRSY
ncbi:uncharacterized protein [Maniola hyperantus]|uniref:uncharacterized protein n=1 Tax=Aphantopus hyperantus TaxID=2795564 RepID=UPI0015699AFC|nr:uncharacterized protein LOC117983935 [Maniola hyperantus]